VIALDAPVARAGDVAPDRGIERELDLVVGEHVAFERSVVIDERHHEALAELTANPRRHAQDPPAPALHDIIDLAEPVFEVLVFVIPKHLDSFCFLSPDRARNSTEAD
jgi:hypothetical protein